MKLALTILLALLCWASVPQAQTTRIIYLATVQGDGTDANPFRSTGFGTVANQNCIDLQSVKRMVCAADSLPAGGGINQLASTFGDTVTAPRKAAIEAALGVTLTASNILDVIAELLTTHARLDGTRWKPLRAGRDGKYKIWLGGGSAAWQQTAWLWDEWHIRDNGLVADVTNYGLDALEPALAWATTLATETWTCADNASLTCVHTWTEFTNTVWSIATNRASMSSSGTFQAEARNDSTLATDDMEVQVTLISTTITGSGFDRCGVIARKENSATRTFYSFFADDNNTDQQWILGKRVAGTFTSLGTNSTNPAPNDVMTIRVDGSSVSGLVNASTLISPVTDTDITGFTYGGIAGASNATTAACVLDNWIGQDYGAAFGPLRRRAG
jgi:hypothetical protein